MAKAKKAATKKKTPAAKKPAQKPSRRTTKRRAPARLDTAARQSLLKPGDSLNELIDDTLTAWGLVKNKVRVSDVTPAQLRSLASKAAKASQRESDLAAKQADKLAPLTDARILTGDAAYRAALKVKRLADAVGVTDQAVADAFANVTARFKNAASAADDTKTTT